MCVAVNVRQEQCDVYCGRGGPFGNPFVIGRDGTRTEVIEKYRQYFYSDRAQSLRALVSRTIRKGQRLGCFCKPLPCHCDVLVEYVNR